ncbi:hypothetical protein Tco_0300825 [Tanacetum coccineum]
MVNESLTAELERYKERVTIFKQRQNVDLNKCEKLIDSQMDDLIRNRNAKLAAFQQEIDTIKETLSNHVKEKESLSKTLTVFKTKSKEKDVIAKEPAVISVIDDEETLILEEESRSKMLDKQNDPISIKQKINISPIDYSNPNKIKEDFGKRFVTQKELSTKQAFWLKHSNYNPDTSVKSHTPVRIAAPSELPKSYVEECNKCLELEIELLKKKDLIEKDVYDKLFENSVTRKGHSHKKIEHCASLIAQIIEKSVENSDLNAQLKEKVFAIASLKNELRKLKGKIIVDTVVSKPSATIAPRMSKLDT